MFSASDLKSKQTIQISETRKVLDFTFHYEVPFLLCTTRDPKIKAYIPEFSDLNG